MEFPKTYVVKRYFGMESIRFYSRNNNSSSKYIYFISDMEDETLIVHSGKLKHQTNFQFRKHKERIYDYYSWKHVHNIFPPVECTSPDIFSLDVSIFRSKLKYVELAQVISRFRHQIFMHLVR